MTGEERHERESSVREMMGRPGRTLNDGMGEAANADDINSDHDLLAELRRAAPGLGSDRERLPVTIEAVEAIVPSELHPTPAPRVRTRVGEVLNGPARTTANHIRRIVPVLLACCDDEPANEATPH